jgi:predicted ATP-dependent protease
MGKASPVKGIEIVAVSTLPEAVRVALVRGKPKTETAED